MSDAPLMTQAMRAVRDEMKLDKYKTVSEHVLHAVRLTVCCYPLEHNESVFPRPMGTARLL